MKRALLLWLFAPLVLTAEIRLFLVNQGTELPVGASHDLGAAFVGIPRDTAFRARNASASPIWLSGLNLASHGGFSFAPLPALPVEVPPGGSVDFIVRFEPLSAGSYSAFLNINGVRATTLMGTAQAPLELPGLQMAVDPYPLRGAQQAKIRLQFASPVRTSGDGELSMAFKPSVPGKADDPSVQFLATGRRSITFTVAEGEDAARFGGSAEADFQTGATAGSIVFTARLGQRAEQLTVVIPSEPVVVDAARSSRVASGIELQVSGFDTSRSTSILSFTFFDLNGRLLTPVAIQVDASQAFSRYYETSDFGGMFTLRAVFPVLGDTAWIEAVDVALFNSIGITRTGHVPIQ